uniref:Uncharacterized protein n=1 Tax=Anopheles maculatus TaxID=74869 RepID=A0A182T1D4_9DIPT
MLILDISGAGPNGGSATSNSTVYPMKKPAGTVSASVKLEQERYGDDGDKHDHLNGTTYQQQHPVRALPELHPIHAHHPVHQQHHREPENQTVHQNPDFGVLMGQPTVSVASATTQPVYVYQGNAPFSTLPCYGVQGVLESQPQQQALESLPSILATYSSSCESAKKRRMLDADYDYEFDQSSLSPDGYQPEKRIRYDGNYGGWAYTPMTPGPQEYPHTNGGGGAASGGGAISYGGTDLLMARTNGPLPGAMNGLDDESSSNGSCHINPCHCEPSPGKTMMCVTETGTGYESSGVVYYYHPANEPDQLQPNSQQLPPIDSTPTHSPIGADSSLSVCSSSSPVKLDESSCSVGKYGQERVHPTTVAMLEPTSGHGLSPTSTTGSQGNGAMEPAAAPNKH